MRGLAVAGLTLMVALGCACDGWQDPQGTQLSLFGDHRCSDPVFGQAADQCCQPHDTAYAVGGTEQDFHLANAEFLACMLLWDVPWPIARARWEAVERFGWNLGTGSPQGVVFSVQLLYIILRILLQNQEVMNRETSCGQRHLTIE